MASPLFLSYSWSDESEANRLDTLLWLRGVPVWRDRRAMRWGGYQQDQVREAIGEICSGFAIHLTPAALDQNGSRFITEVELPAMDDRRRADHDFFSGAVFDGYDLAAAEEVLKPAGDVKLPPPTTQVGAECEKGTAGCSESGEFDGSFFGE